ncbi:hypothetical protein WAT24_12195 [Fulvimonas yonginensis]|uniref:Uncharacterized protein n=2 Tax=Fulvimonas yonginensis TaxID=1495200 RepID=A0ABU8JD76_9GAMM
MRETEFELSLSSIDAKPGHSPTAWLTADTRFGTVSINGVAQKTSLTLSVATHRILAIRQILSIDHGAYFFGWLMSVAIGLAALALAAHRPSEAMSIR